MPRINFYVREITLRSGTRSIYEQMTFHGKRVKVPVKQEVYPHAWDSKKQRLKTKHPYDREINSLLQNIGYSTYNDPPIPRQIDLKIQSKGQFDMEWQVSFSRNYWINLSGFSNLRAA